MKLRLKGVAMVHKRLAAGQRVTYRYAWRGGPRLPGLPGSPEFMMAYNEAHEMRRKGSDAPSSARVFASIIDAYEASRDFLGKSDKTRKDYGRYLKIIRAEFGDLELAAFSSPALRGVLKSWRDSMADRARTADYAWAVLERDVLRLKRIRRWQDIDCILLV